MNKTKAPELPADFVGFLANVIRCELTTAARNDSGRYGLDYGSKSQIENLIAETIQRAGPVWAELVDERKRRAAAELESSHREPSGT